MNAPTLALIIGFGISLIGCSGPVDEQVAIGIDGGPVATDAASDDATDQESDAQATDAQATDAQATDGWPPDAGVPDTGADPARPLRVNASLRDGTLATGEIVAVYDRTRWWNPGQGGLVYALFDPDRYTFGDADRAFVFVSSDEVTGIDSMQPMPVTYREFLAERGFEFDRSPFDERAYVVMGNDGYHLDEDGYGDFAFDLQLTDDQGRRFSGTGAQNTDHYVWDAPVVSPVSGTVFEIVDSGVDNPPGSYPEDAINNNVGIRLGGNFYAYLLHFRQDGVDNDLAVGQRIQVGTPLGRIGNSGVTLEPHLHLVLLWYDPVAQRSYSVPAAFRQVESSPGPLGPWQSAESFVPNTGVWIR